MYTQEPLPSRLEDALLEQEVIRSCNQVLAWAGLTRRQVHSLQDMQHLAKHTSAFISVCEAVLDRQLPGIVPCPSVAAEHAQNLEITVAGLAVHLGANLAHISGTRLAEGSLTDILDLLELLVVCCPINHSSPTSPGKAPSAATASHLIQACSPGVQSWASVDTPTHAEPNRPSAEGNIKLDEDNSSQLLPVVSFAAAQLSNSSTEAGAAPTVAVTATGCHGGYTADVHTPTVPVAYRGVAAAPPPSPTCDDVPSPRLPRPSPYAHQPAPVPAPTPTPAPAPAQTSHLNGLSSQEQQQQQPAATSLNGSFRCGAAAALDDSASSSAVPPALHHVSSTATQGTSAGVPAVRIADGLQAPPLPSTVGALHVGAGMLQAPQTAAGASSGRSETASQAGILQEVQVRAPHVSQSASSAGGPTSTQTPVTGTNRASAAHQPVQGVGVFCTQGRSSMLGARSLQTGPGLQTAAGLGSAVQPTVAGHGAMPVSTSSLQLVAGAMPVLSGALPVYSLPGMLPLAAQACMQANLLSQHSGLLAVQAGLLAQQAGLLASSANPWAAVSPLGMTMGQSQLLTWGGPPVPTASGYQGGQHTLLSKTVADICPRPAALAATTAMPTIRVEVVHRPASPQAAAMQPVVKAPAAAASEIAPVTTASLQRSSGTRGGSRTSLPGVGSVVLQQQGQRSTRRSSMTGSPAAGSRQSSPSRETSPPATRRRTTLANCSSRGSSPPVRHRRSSRLSSQSPARRSSDTASGTREGAGPLGTYVSGYHPAAGVGHGSLPGTHIQGSLPAANGHGPIHAGMYHNTLAVHPLLNASGSVSQQSVHIPSVSATGQLTACPTSSSYQRTTQSSAVSHSSCHVAAAEASGGAPRGSHSVVPSQAPGRLSNSSWFDAVVQPPAMAAGPHVGVISNCNGLQGNACGRIRNSTECDAGHHSNGESPVVSSTAAIHVQQPSGLAVPVMGDELHPSSSATDLRHSSWDGGAGSCTLLQKVSSTSPRHAACMHTAVASHPGVVRSGPPHHKRRRHKRVRLWRRTWDQPHDQLTLNRFGQLIPVVHKLEPWRWSKRVVLPPLPGFRVQQAGRKVQANAVRKRRAVRVRHVHRKESQQQVECGQCSQQGASHTGGRQEELQLLHDICALQAQLAELQCNRGQAQISVSSVEQHLQHAPHMAAASCKAGVNPGSCQVTAEAAGAHSFPAAVPAAMVASHALGFTQDTHTTYSAVDTTATPKAAMQPTFRPLPPAEGLGADGPILTDNSVYRESCPVTIGRSCAGRRSSSNSVNPDVAPRQLSAGSYLDHQQHGAERQVDLRQAAAQQQQHGLLPVKQPTMGVHAKAQDLQAEFLTLQKALHDQTTKQQPRRTSGKAQEQAALEAALQEAYDARKQELLRLQHTVSQYSQGDQHAGKLVVASARQTQQLREAQQQLEAVAQLLDDVTTHESELQVKAERVNRLADKANAAAALYICTGLMPKHL